MFATCRLNVVPRQVDGAAPVPKRAEASRHAAEEELEWAHDDREHLEKRERERDNVRGKERVSGRLRPSRKSCTRVARAAQHAAWSSSAVTMNDTTHHTDDTLNDAAHDHSDECDEDRTEEGLPAHLAGEKVGGEDDEEDGAKRKRYERTERRGNRREEPPQHIWNKHETKPNDSADEAWDVEKDVEHGAENRAGELHYPDQRR